MKVFVVRSTWVSENSDSECFKLYPGKVLELLLIPNPYKKGQNG